MKEQNVKEKKKSKFSIKMQKKLVVLFGIVLLAFVCLSARLLVLARDKETLYQKQVLAQQQYDSTTLPYRRGDIVDAKGTVIATSEKVYNLIIDAKVMNTEIGGKTPYLEPTLTALGQYFDLDMGAIREHVAANKNSAWYVAKKQMSYDEISGFKAAQKENPNIRGVWFEEEYKRIYPYGAMAADVIGFSNMDNQGSYGLEEYYSEVLNGVNGREYGYVNDDLALERTVKAALDGNNIHSTVDANVQLIVEKYLKQFMEEHRDEYHPGNGAENVGCVIQWVDTGEILAMASYPTYDLNDVRNPQALLGSMMVEQVDLGNGYYEIKKNGKVIDQAVLDAMNEDELYLNLNNLWKNYCITGTYEPGSVAKPFTVAAALEKGTIAPNSTFECNGMLEIGGHEIKCHSSMRGTHTLEQAVATSCNVSMMKIAQTLGAEQFSEYQNIFNFGLRTNIDLAGEARTASLIYTADRMGPTDLATNSFGQNFNVTMIQTITAFSSLINGGYYYEPHMVSKITNAGGATVENIEPRVLKQTISESTSGYIRQYCRAVVESGTGKTARPAGYMIGGKTGTAETIDPNTHKRSETDHVVSFMGYAPADDPKIAIYVVVDRPNVEKQGNARLATGIVRNILTEVLPYLNIFMTEELSETEIQELAALNLEITTQYTGGRTEGSQEGGDGSRPSEPDGAAGSQYWMSFPVDPESGYRVDPATGFKYDAQEGFLVDSALGADTPVNPDIN
ncbi:MAG: penicillin-binding transpeptidase domain-containing protein [Butyrivibrio sp.]|nr:penicillin-binding transpeptidase domain-containing protein [Acetatifactor muris]MCM1561256.1 penicillin-binding transpeptidase domain-containing protein [Butyrivibrio sp.]